MTRGDAAAWSLVVFLAFLVQGSTILPAWMQPDLLIVAVFFCGYRHGRLAGLAVGALSGLLVDLFSGLIIGPHVLSRGIAGYGAGWFARVFFGRSRLLILAAVPALVLIEGLALQAVQNAFTPPGLLDLRGRLAGGLVLGLLAAFMERIWGRERESSVGPRI